MLSAAKHLLLLVQIKQKQIPRSAPAPEAGSGAQGARDDIVGGSLHSLLEPYAGCTKPSPYDGVNGSVGALDAAARRERGEPQSWNLFWELPKRLFQVVFRVVPYPTRPRLIRIGSPGRRSPVLVTTNYDLTVRRVRRALDGLDCWLLVAPAGGVDVWCAASGGRFTIESVISILKTTRIGDLMDHRRLILPQLCATGINVFELRRRTGWAGVFGPVQAEDVPEYLRTRRKPEAMMRVPFAVRDRLEMATAMWGSLSLRYTLFPCLAFGWRVAPWFVLLLALLCLGVSLGCFVLPGKTFVQKAGFAALPGLLGLIGSLAFLGQGAALFVVKWTLLVGLAAFLAGTAFPSYSPLWACGYSKLFYGASDLKLAIVEEQCIGCKICDLVCPVECFATGENRKMLFVNPDICVGCGACVIQCPTDAIINQVAEDHRLQTACG